MFRDTGVGNDRYDELYF